MVSTSGTFAVIVARMSFSAFITTNYDQLLEKALAKNRKKFYTIIEDLDVCRWKSDQLPYLKLHGCITRPSGLIAAEDEYKSINNNSHFTIINEPRIKDARDFRYQILNNPSFSDTEKEYVSRLIRTDALMLEQLNKPEQANENIRRVAI